MPPIYYRRFDSEHSEHIFNVFSMNPLFVPYHKQAAFVPAVDNYRASGGRGFLSGPFHFLHQFQEWWSLVWSLLIRPRGVPVLPQTALLSPTLVHTHRWHLGIKYGCDHVLHKWTREWFRPVALYVYPNCYLGVSCYDNNERRARQQTKKVRVIKKS